jgi:signal transduction histidine kinase
MESIAMMNQSFSDPGVLMIGALTKPINKVVVSLESRGYTVSLLETYHEQQLTAELEKGNLIIVLANPANDAHQVVGFFFMNKKFAQNVVLIVVTDEDEDYKPPYQEIAIEKISLDRLLPFIEKRHAIYCLERELKSEKAVFRKVMDQFPMPITIIDPSYRILYVNEAQRVLTPEVCPGIQCYRSMAGSLTYGGLPCSPCAVTNTFTTGKSEIIDRWGVKKDGKPWHSLQRSAPIIENGHVIAAIKAVEDRSDLISQFELENNPEIQLKNSIRDIFNYIAHAGFCRGLFLDIEHAPEGGVIAKIKMANGFEDKQIEGKNAILNESHPVVARLKNYENRLAKEGKYEFIYQAIKRYEHFLPELGSPTDAIEAPIFVKGSVLGLMVFIKNDTTQRHDKQKPVETDPDIFEHIHYLLRCVRNIEKIYLDRERRIKIDEDNYLLSFAEELASLRQNDDLYTIVLQRVADYLGDAYGFMMLFDHDKERLYKTAWVGASSEQWEAIDIKQCDLPCCVALLENRRALIQDFQNHNLASAQLPYLLDWLRGVQSWVCYPLHVGDKPLGVLGLYSNERFFFTDARLAFIERALEIVQLVVARMQTEEASRQAEAANAQLQMALRTVHNLRTPSTAARNYLEVLNEWMTQKRCFNRNNSAEDRAQAMSILNKAFDQLVRIERLAADIQGLLKPLRLRSAPVKLPALIQDTIEGVIGPIQPPVETVYRIETPDMVANVDVESIKEVFEQFVENALKAMRESAQRRLTVAIQTKSGQAIEKVKLSKDKMYIVATIQDAGAGMPLEIQDKIFQPWVSASPSSTGLGLAIMKKIVEEHDGKVWLEESNPSGTAFSVAIPVYQGETR